MATNSNYPASGCTANYCISNRSSCGANRAVTLSNVVTGHVIKASDIELLRANTVAELNRWNLNAHYNFAIRSRTGFGTGEVISAAKTNNLILDLNGTRHGSTGTVTAGSVIAASKLAASMLSIYNSLRTDCICNADCGPHSTCACNNDCGCNYSDERLKENITYLGSK